MSTSLKILTATESIRKKTRLFRDIWSRRIDFVISQLVSTRLSLGKVHEGELGLVLADFIKETFRSVSIVRKVERLSKSLLGKTFITKVILDNVPISKKLLSSMTSEG